MDSVYTIEIRIKIPEGEIPIGNFFLGYDFNTAINTFNSLVGERESQRQTLSLYLLEKSNSQSEAMDYLNCTLGQLQHNCKIITRDAFRTFSIDGGLKRNTKMIDR